MIAFLNVQRHVTRELNFFSKKDFAHSFQTLYTSCLEEISTQCSFSAGSIALSHTGSSPAGWEVAWELETDELCQHVLFTKQEKCFPPGGTLAFSSPFWTPHQWTAEVGPLLVSVVCYAVDPSETASIKVATANTGCRVNPLMPTVAHEQHSKACFFYTPKTPVTANVHRGSQATPCVSPPTR